MRALHLATALLVLAACTRAAEAGPDAGSSAEFRCPTDAEDFLRRVAGRQTCLADGGCRFGNPDLLFSQTAEGWRLAYSGSRGATEAPSPLKPREFDRESCTLWVMVVGQPSLPLTLSLDDAGLTVRTLGVGRPALYHRSER